MDADNILMIPYLSKELNLIGFPTLPYTIRKKAKKSSSKSSEDALEVIFDSRLMVKSLTSICFKLVNEVKQIGEDTSLDKLNFETLKLQKQLKLKESQTEKVITELTNAKKVNQQLQEKVYELQKKLQQYKVEQHTSAKRNQTKEDILKHTVKKKEMEIFELHKAIWKQFNMADQNYFPQNFELLQLNQPDFSKLWNTVQYSDTRTKEEALKKAVRTLQNNNKTLMEENFSLKIYFLNVIQEMQDVFKLMVDKLHMPRSIINSFKTKEIFQDIGSLNMSQYRKTLQKHFQIFRKICDLFDEASFYVSDDLFVCWSNVTRKI